jgi:urease accessory protein
MVGIVDKYELCLNLGKAKEKEQKIDIFPFLTPTLTYSCTPAFLCHACPMINNRLIKSALTTLLCLGWAQVAWAHVEGGQAAGFITGLQHPWSGLDHVLAMIAVGLWGAQLGSPALWILPIAFPMMMAMGAMMGLMGIPVPGVEIGIALSAIVLGAMILANLRPKLPLAIAMVGIFAIFHGHAHGTELPAGQSGLLYSMGFVIATGCLHALGIALGLVNGLPAGKLVLRGAGTFIAAMGVVFLWRAIL